VVHGFSRDLEHQKGQPYGCPFSVTPRNGFCLPLRNSRELSSRRSVRTNHAHRRHYSGSVFASRLSGQALSGRMSIGYGAIMPGQMLPPSDTGYLEIRVATQNVEYPTLSDIGYFTHDFNLLYEFLRVKSDPSYRDFGFNRFFVYRNQHRIDPEDRLYIRHISQESPPHIDAVVLALPFLPKLRSEMATAIREVL